MIGTQRTGRLPGIQITGTAHDGLSVLAHGQPAQLAVITADGQVLVAGQVVADEVEASAINLYQAWACGQGHQRIGATPAGAPAHGS